MRTNTRAITFGGHTMIFDPRDPTVEIWNLEQSKKITTFEPGYYLLGLEVFLIDKEFGTDCDTECFPFLIDPDWDYCI